MNVTLVSLPRVNEFKQSLQGMIAVEMAKFILNGLIKVNDLRVS